MPVEWVEPPDIVFDGNSCSIFTSTSTIPKEYKQGKPNPKTLSSAKVKSATAEIGKIGLGVNGEPVGVYMKDQYYIYNSTNFPRYETKYNVVVPIDTLADKLNGNSNNGYYKGWVLTGVSEDKRKAYIANPNGGILSSDITIDAEQTVATKSVID